MVIIILAIKMILMECTNHQLGRGVGVNTLARIASLPDPNVGCFVFHRAAGNLFL